MSYWVRVFCKSAAVPSVREMFSAMSAAGYSLGLGDEGKMFPVVDLDTTDWMQADIVRQGRLLMVAEITRQHDSRQGSLLEEELEQFVELLDGVEPSEDSEQVKQHLAATRLIIAFQLLKEFGDGDVPLFNVLCNWLIDRNDGLYHADNTGVMRRADDDEVLVEVG